MSNKIVGVAYNTHDQNFFEDFNHIQLERLTRRKYNADYCSNDIYYDKIYSFPDEDLICSFSHTDSMYRAREFGSDKVSEITNKTYTFRPKTLWERLCVDNMYYIDHHQSHAAYAFLTSGFNESDIIVFDGGGALYHTIFIDKDFNIIDLSHKLKLGQLWQLLACGTNYNGVNLSSPGKLMGLAGYGSMDDEFYSRLELFPHYEREYDTYAYIANKMITETRHISSEDKAFTLQQYTLDKIEEILLPLKTSDNLCISGGVGYNGYVNELFSKHYNLHVPAAIGDEGQSIGCYMHADYIINNNIHKPSVYCGLDYRIED